MPATCRNASAFPTLLPPNFKIAVRATDILPHQHARTTSTRRAGKSDQLKFTAGRPQWHATIRSSDKHHQGYVVNVPSRVKLAPHRRKVRRQTWQVRIAICVHLAILPSHRRCRRAVKAELWLYFAVRISQSAVEASKQVALLLRRLR